MPRRHGERDHSACASAHSVATRWQRVTKAEEFSHYNTSALQEPTEKPLAPAQLDACSLVELDSGGGRVRPVHLFLDGTGGLPGSVRDRGVRLDHGLPSTPYPPQFSDSPARGMAPGPPGLPCQSRWALAVGGEPPHPSSAQRRRRRPSQPTP